MKKLYSIIIVIFSVLFSFHLQGQWTAVLDDVLPVAIAVSPNYHQDQTVYIVDANARIWISETGGITWNTIYQAPNPSDPTQAVLDLLISPNFMNDNAIVMVHKDGTMELSADRGQHWGNLPVPIGSSDIVFSPQFAEDHTMHCITGVFGPVKFYKSTNGGASWGTFISDIFLGGGYYSKLWNSIDPTTKDTFAIKYDNPVIYLSEDGGVTWKDSFVAEDDITDFAFTPQFGQDSTAFVATTTDIYVNIQGGKEPFWTRRISYEGSSGIKLLLSPTYLSDKTIFAAVTQIGIQRSVNGGFTWHSYNDGLTSTMPISIAISDVSPYTLFAGTMGAGGTPDKLWKFQSYTGLDEPSNGNSGKMFNSPNPFRNSTDIVFKLKDPGNVQISIYDITGQIVCVVMNEYLDKGGHSVTFDNSSHRLKPGIYFCKLISAGDSQTIRMIVNR